MIGLLKLANTKCSNKSLKAVDYLDDGTPIALQIEISSESGDAVFNFTESGDEVYGNLMHQGQFCIQLFSMR